jgi:hypothetical protein
MSLVRTGSPNQVLIRHSRDDGHLNRLFREEPILMAVHTPGWTKPTVHAVTDPETQKWSLFSSHARRANGRKGSAWSAVRLESWRRDDAERYEGSFLGTRLNAMCGIPETCATRPVHAQVLCTSLCTTRPETRGDS